MNLAIDAVGNTAGGGLTVLNELLGHIATRRDLESVTVFVSPGVGRPAAGEPRLNLVEMEGPHRSYPKRVSWYLSGLRKQATERGADAVLCLNGMGLGAPDLPAFHFVQQSLPFCPEALAEFSFRARFRFGIIRRLTRFSLARSRGIFVQTPWMEDLVAGMVAGRVQVGIARPGMEDREPRVRHGEEAAPVLLYVGSDSAHKNVRRLVEAFGSVRGRWPSAQLRVTLDARPGYAGPGISFLGRLSREELFDQYEEAALLVMPSLVETVGLPLLEAMSAGTPVVAADRPYAHDVAGGCGRYFDPLSAAALAEALVAALGEPGLGTSMRDAAARRYEVLKQQPSYDRLVDRLVAMAGPGGRKGASP